MNTTQRENLIRRVNEIDGLTNDERSALIGLLRETKSYGLVWENKVEAVEERLRDELPILTEVPERAIISDDKNAPNHIIIEGDNLEALATLAYTHDGEIDVIYIDPPYNRGEDDFKYNDKFIDKENPFKHSLWLCFMSKRLRLAKKLLKDDGVIIIHIDEHEYNALNLYLESEVFSNYNNLGTIIWNKMNPKGDAKGIATMHEYIVIYSKNKDAFVNSGETISREKPNAEAIIKKAKILYSKLGKKDIPEEIKSAVKPFGFKKELLHDFEVMYDLELINKEFQSWLAKSSFGKGEKAYKYISNTGRVFRTVSMAWPNKEVAPDDYWIPLIHPEIGIECPMPSKGWRNPTKTMNKLMGLENPYKVAGLTIKGEISFSQKKNGALNIPERIYYLDENMSENVPSIYNDGSSDDTLLQDIGVSFEYPKTVSVASYLLKNIKSNATTILDFFAGSGTTLHATMQLNAEDGGHRKCILVTNNENNICEEVTYERNKRVINGYTTPKGETVEGLRNNNLRYYKTGFVSRERTPQNMRKLVLLATDMLCIKEDIYDEKPMFGEQETYRNVFRFFDNGKKQMLVIYREEAIDQIVDIIRDMEVAEPILVYVFSTSEDPWEGSFEDVGDKVKLCALPMAIYNTYKRVLPKKRDEIINQNEEGGDE